MKGTKADPLGRSCEAGIVAGQVDLFEEADGLVHVGGAPEFLVS